MNTKQAIKWIKKCMDENIGEEYDNRKMLEIIRLLKYSEITNKQKEALKKVFSCYKKIESERKYRIAQLVVFAKWDLINTIPELMEAFPVLSKK